MSETRADHRALIIVRIWWAGAVFAAIIRVRILWKQEIMCLTTLPRHLLWTWCADKKKPSLLKQPSLRGKQMRTTLPRARASLESGRQRQQSFLKRTSFERATEREIEKFRTTMN